ncbi:hypothetical protein OIDMADRAFT_20551, partial [Oidiodendron maius Zn]
MHSMRVQLISARNSIAHLIRPITFSWSLERDDSKTASVISQRHVLSTSKYFWEPAVV